MFLAIVLIVLGFAMLMFGADVAVKGAVEVANRFKIPTFVIGLTIVALGTSIPEFIVSLKSALIGNPGIALGNVIGSNIANIFLVLGVSALIHPIVCSMKMFYKDTIFLLVVTLVFTLFVISGKLVVWHGGILLALMLIFLWYNYDVMKNNLQEEQEDMKLLANKSWVAVLFYLFGGLGLISFGSDVLIGGATKLAKICGLGDEIIALTIIAIGTSIPELATSAVSAFKKQNGIALGNVIGSNIWNIVFVMGATSSITNVNVANQFISIDIWIMVFAAFILLPMLIFKNKITRIEGGILFFLFICYILLQVFMAKGLIIIN